VTLRMKIDLWEVARATSLRALIIGSIFIASPSLSLTQAGANEKSVMSRVGDCHLLKNKQFQSRLAELKKVPCKSIHNIEVFKVGPLPKALDLLNLNSVDFGGNVIQRCPRPENAPEELSAIRMSVIKASSATKNRNWFRCELYQENDLGEIQRWKGKKL
jgi:hypothetical protein